MINALKKIKIVNLDLILSIACSQGDALENVIKWVLTTLSPRNRLGWLLSIAMDFTNENKE